MCLSVKNAWQLPEMKIGRMGGGGLSEGFGSGHVHLETPTPTFPPDLTAAEAAGFRGERWGRRRTFGSCHCEGDRERQEATRLGNE